MREAVAGEKILVIDDEQSTRSMLRLLLGAYGYTVHTAVSGEDGLEVFSRERPAVVLTDIRMPGIDGIEILKRLKQIDPDVEVIVITGHGDMDLAIQSLQIEASDFINKPIQREALEVALRRAHEKSGMRRQIREHTLDLEAKVREATSKLAKTCQQLKTLCDIGQSVGETTSLEGIIALLKDRIQLVTRLRCHGLLVLNYPGTALVKGQPDLKLIKTSEEIVAALKQLDEPHTLSEEEISRIFRTWPEAGAEKILMLPIARKSEPPAGVALIGMPQAGTDDELSFAVLMLSLAAGALRRAVLHEEELSALRELAAGREIFGALIGRHQKMCEVFKLVSNVADSNATVLILGESGTGKELVARRIHELSGRKDRPFVVINCAAYPQTLLESELFGHEKGAFTGAASARKGCFELAHTGTIFLDEIGEIPPAAQVKLLRALQFKEFQRIGGERPIKVDVRVLAATSRNLRRAIEEEEFREDLYYRLNVIPISLPPLRERMSDLPFLAAHFLKRLSNRSSGMAVEIMPEAMHILMNHRWPGNIRELENVLEHACLLARGKIIEVGDLPAYLRETQNPVQASDEGLEEVEKQHLIRILDQCKGNKIEAARRLKISRSTLYRKLEHYGLGNQHFA